MPEWLTPILLKLTGSLAGSTIAALFRRSARWAFQIVAGAYFGFVSGPWLMDWRGWPMTTDYILLAGSITGVIAYSILEAIFAPNWKELFHAWVRGRIKAAEK